MAGEKVKQLWKCRFNGKSEFNVFYRHAYTEKQAWMLCCRAIAKRKNAPLNYVTALYDGSKDNYVIELETEIKEVA